MSLSFKLMPGVRIRVNHRGVRTSVGPRLARVHVGAGRVGVSTGVGPMSLYASTRTGQRSRTQGRLAAAQDTHRQLAAMANAQLAYDKRSPTERRTSDARQEAARRKAECRLQAAAAEAIAALRALTAVHLNNFDPIEPPTAPMPTRRMTDDEVFGWFEAHELANAPRFDRAARQAARERAGRLASEELEAQQKRALEAQASCQETLDAEWAKLLANDPDVVFETVDDALDDNDATAAAIGYLGDSLAVVMTAPSKASLPNCNPERINNGWRLVDLTLHQQQRLYLRAIAAHTIVTAKEVFAVAPNLRSTHIAVIADDQDTTSTNWSVLLVAHFQRQNVATDINPTITPETVLQQLASVTTNYRGDSDYLLPLPSTPLVIAILSLLARQDDIEPETASDSLIP